MRKGVFMARKSLRTKTINNITYYTSTYFATEVFVSKRYARDYLEDFKSIDGHTNPKLYEKSIMDKAIDSYKHGHSTKEKYEKYKMKKLIAEEQIRSGLEEDEEYKKMIEFNQIIDEGRYYESLDNMVYNSYLNNNFEKELLIKMLEYLFFIQGYKFDIEKYRDDFKLHNKCEADREPGIMRTEEHIKAFDRLKSQSAYLQNL